MITEKNEEIKNKKPVKRERTKKLYNLDLLDYCDFTDDVWEMPIIKGEQFVPDDLVGFNDVKKIKDKGTPVHFYLNDYQFERIWTCPEKYTEMFKRIGCIISPDFSMYMDMAMPMKIWNVFRSRLIGAYYQSQGIKVIPTVGWAEPMTYDFCFRGISKGSVVAVGTMGVKKNKEATKIWKQGMEEMIMRLSPSTILIYGGEIDFDYGKIPVKYFSNKIVDRFNLMREKKAKLKNDIDLSVVDILQDIRKD